MTMSQSKIYQSNLCTIIIIYCKCYYFMNIERKKSCITYYEPCLNEVFTPACDLKHTPFYLLKSQILII